MQAITQATQQAAAKKTIAALRKRLERWELDHLRALAAHQEEQLHAAHDRIEQLESEVQNAWQTADSWREDAMRLVEDLEEHGQQVGLTQSGALVVAAQQEGGAA